MSNTQARTLVLFCCSRLQRIAALAALAVEGPEPEEAAAHLRDFLSEYKRLVAALPQP